MCVLMIVEDEPLEREALNQILHNEFGQKIKFIVEAKTGPEAIKKAHEFKPDISIIDIGIPALNGIDVQKELIKFLPEIYTIIISAYSNFDYVQRAMRYKVKEYLLKPVKNSELIESVNKIINTFDESDGSIYSFKSPKSDVVKKSVSFMNENFKEKIDLNTISKQIHLNPQYFSRIFKKEMNISCIEYLNMLRVNYAIKLLSTTIYPSYRVAIECGFADPSYFSRVFTKYTNLTPAEYHRKNYNKKVI